MVSRRNIRVKVMQTIYSLEAASNETKAEEALNVLKRNVEQSKQLFTYLIYCIIETAKYAETDAQQKSGKHLPNFDDLNINTKIAENGLIAVTTQNKSFRKVLSGINLTQISDSELLKKTYQSLVRSSPYRAYISDPGRNKKDDKQIMEYIFSDLMLPNEDFVLHLEENFVNWEDDGDMMITLMAAFFQKPDTFDFTDIVTAEKWEFASELLACVNNKRDYCLELIKPKLKNWDAERIAALDMILMQMGVCEFLYFETIPPRVTINEYIDLAKDYSTPQSGQFVNGILDSIHKELLADNKIHKKKFKNSTL